MTLAPLFKKTTGGRVQRWEIKVVPRAGGATIVTTYGLVDGQQVTTEDHVLQGKNVGKANATTPLQQAEREAQAKWQRQVDRQHYSEDPSGEASAAKRAAAPMTAQSYWAWDKAKRAWARTTHAGKVRWDGALAQPKFDGHRGLLTFRGDGSWTLVSRKGLPIETVPHLAEFLGAWLRKRLDGWPVTLDGELYCHGVPVTTVGGWLRKEQPDSQRVELRVYDHVSPAPYRDRFRTLRDMLGLGKLKADAPVKLVETVPVADEDALMRYQARCIERGYEGAMLRHGDAGYDAGKRSASLLKVKSFEDREFEVVGVKEGRGTFAGMAVFQCTTPEGYRFDVTAPGSHDEKRGWLEDAGAALGKALTVRYSQMTRTDEPVPFHPVAIGFREDV